MDIICLPKKNLVGKLKSLLERYFVLEDKMERDRWSHRHTSYNSGVTYPVYDACCIIFYEWSNINGSSLKFTSKKAFFQFLKVSKIGLTKDQEEYLNRSSYMFAYATCKKNQPILLLETTKTKLEQKLNEKDDMTIMTKRMMGNYPIMI